jgi:quinol monooxygenase YgiN
VVELQRLELKADKADEAVRMARELWQILGRKQSCTLHHLYRSQKDKHRWLAYSEWRSLNELGGARKELARSPIYRRFHSMLERSSERAYEPVGAARSLHGANFSAEPWALMVEFGSAPENPEHALDFIKEIEGYGAHLIATEVGGTDVLVAIAHFDDQSKAEAAKSKIEAHEPIRGHIAAIEIFKS